MASIVTDRLDGLSSSTAYKGPCRLASPVQVTPSGLRIVDGLQTVANDRVVLTNQTDPRQNGIYVVDTGPWRRAADFSKNRDVVQGTRVWVNEGDSGPAELEVSSDNPVRIGVDPITFELSAGSVNAAALSQAVRDAQDAANNAIAQVNVPLFATALGLAAVTVPSGTTGLRTNEYRAGKGGGALYLKGAAAAGSVPSIGDDWQLAEALVNLRMFGAIGDGVTNDAAAFTAADTYAGQSPIYLPPGTYLTTYTPLGAYYGPGLIKIGSELIALDRRVAQRVDTTPPDVADEDDEGGIPGRRLNFVLGQGAAPNLASGSDANVAIGYKAGRGQTNQSRGTFIGYLAGGPGDGYANTYIGASAGSQSAFGERNLVGGATAGKWLGTNDPVGTAHDLWIAPDTTDFGLATRNPTFWSLLTTGGVRRGTPLPATLPTTNADAARNVILGRDALNHAPKAFGNVAIGYRAARFFYNASDSVAIGYEALGDGLLSYRNNAVGVTAMNYLQSGQYNDALGYAALKYNTFTDFNVAIGAFAALNLGSTFTDSATAKAAIEGNIAIGMSALRYAVSGLYNVAIGMNAMGNTTALVEANRNVAVGYSAGFNNTTGGNNTYIGQRAGLNNTTGSNCVIIGGQAGETLQGGGNMTNLSGVIAIGYQAAVSAANQCQIGNSSVTTYAYGPVQSRSDERDKADIRDTVLGLDFIKKLRPVDFRWNYREDYIERDEDGNVIGRLAADGSKKRSRYHHGFIAQDIEALIETGVIDDFGGYQNHLIGGGADVKSIGDEFSAPLVRSVQELASLLDQVISRMDKIERKAA